MRAPERKPAASGTWNWNASARRTMVLNAAYSVSIFVKKGTERYCTMGDGRAAVWHAATFDFQTTAWIGAGAQNACPNALSL